MSHTAHSVIEQSEDRFRMSRAADRAPRNDGGGRRWATIGGVTAALVLAVSWMLTPSAFGDRAHGETHAGPVEAGSEIHIDTGLSAARPVELREVVPVEGGGSVPFEATLSVCSEGSVGVVAGTLSEHCAERHPARGARFHRSPQQVVVTLVAERPGTIIIEGFETTYRDGVRFGSQRAGHRVTVDVTVGDGG